MKPGGRHLVGWPDRTGIHDASRIILDGKVQCTIDLGRDTSHEGFRNRRRRNVFDEPPETGNGEMRMSQSRQIDAHRLLGNAVPGGNVPIKDVAEPHLGIGESWTRSSSF